MQNKIEWIESGNYEDIKYHKFNGIAKITINRPEVRNAFRPSVRSTLKGICKLNKNSRR